MDAWLWTLLEASSKLPKVNMFDSDMSEEIMLFVALVEFIVALVIDWYTVVLTGTIIMFFIPAVVLILFYAVAVFLYAYKEQRKDSYKDKGSWSDHFWNSARLSVCTFISLLGKYWHAHEVVGIENIPDRGPALLVFYHGTLPIDLYYSMAYLRIKKRRRLKIIVDHFLFKMPGMKLVMQVFGCFTGPAAECVKMLRRGHLLAICPGGVREAIFATDKYPVMWKTRTGFAKVALAAKVPIIPVFTTNCRESFKVVRTGQKFTRWLYERTRLPFVLYYGGFPVKMKTFFGPRIQYDQSMTPKEVAALCQQSIEGMIKEHQTVPGSALGGLKDRWMPDFLTSSTNKKKTS